MKIYQFAIVPSPGTYGNGEVNVVMLTNDRKKATTIARRMTAEYQRKMAPYGGSTGGYLAVEWGRPGRSFWADMPPMRICPNDGGLK